LEKLEKVKNRLNSSDRGDVVGLRRKLEKLKTQNEVMQKL